MEWIEIFKVASVIVGLMVTIGGIIAPAWYSIKRTNEITKAQQEKDVDHENRIQTLERRVDVQGTEIDGMSTQLGEKMDSIKEMVRMLDRNVRDLAAPQHNGGQ